MFDKAPVAYVNNFSVGTMELIKNVIIEMRPKQWYKNLLLFIGIIFSINFLHLNYWFSTILGFISFCLLSSSIYIINDVIDVEKDRLHPVKCNRPIASGRLNPYVAFIIALLLVFIAIFISMYVGILFSLIACIYLAVTLLYDFMLKNVYLVDVFTISIGLVLRAVAGCTAISVVVSPWLILCTFLMALFLAFGKRRHELLLLNENASKHRPVLKKYSSAMLDSFINISTSALIVSYCLYTFFSSHTFMMLTIPFALYGIFRYIDRLYKMEMGGEPELIFKDKYMITDILIWTCTILLVMLRIPEFIIAFI
ncbi:decaprenyl-phosphate phosphoribosyltransferase [Methanocella conradii]|uniref:decaprenyl-phosphate phosphoribosyltransferase n=1 Tax=Methanocella conradii TaxID=1175444 RepID=UPI0024B35103|nr:decaprenyl-phosphate phosphoribosyltransferase [Methanocella conradii]MDI6896833.1 decaprenyl-phosphate phosphoribosyltransferase [Methanocella conradii]